MSKNKNRSDKSNNNVLLWSIVVAVSVVIGVLVTWALSRSSETETYYVLNHEVSQGAPLTAEDFTARVAKKDSAPQNAHDPAYFADREVYAKVNLAAGDVVGDSVISDSATMASGITDGKVMTSFSIDRKHAVGGLITSDQYFDLMVVDNNGAYYPFVNLRSIFSTIDVTTQTDDQGNTTTNDSNISYAVALTPGDAARLQTLLATKQGKIRMVLSSNDDDTVVRSNLEAYKGVFSYDPATDDTITESKIVNSAEEQHKNQGAKAGQGAGANPDSNNADNN